MRRVLRKSGASLGNMQNQNELDRRPGFLALTVKSGQPDKGVAGFNEWCVLHGIPTIRPVCSRQAVEFEMFVVRVKAIDGKLAIVAGSA